MFRLLCALTLLGLDDAAGQGAEEDDPTLHHVINQILENPTEGVIVASV